MKKVLLALWLAGGLLQVSAQQKTVQKQDSIARNIRLEEMVVTGTRASDKTPIAHANIGKEELRKVNLGQDLPFLLLQTPSLVASSDAGAGVGYTGLRIRGTDASRINVTVNGIPFNDAESHGTYWVDMPDFASSVEDLQIQRGVGTSTNGAGAFGASINMKSEKSAMNPYAELNGSYGSFNTSRATLKLGTGLLRNHWAFDARLSNIHSDGYIDRAKSNLQSYFAQGGYFSQSTVVKFITFGGTEHTYHAWYGVPKDSLATNRTYNPSGYMGTDASGNPLFYKNQTDNYTQNHYQLLLTHELNPNLSLNAALFYIKGGGYYEEYKVADPLKVLTQYGLKEFDYNGETVSIRDLIQQKWLKNDFGGMVFSLNYKKDRLDATFGGGVNRYVGNSFGKVLWVKDYFVVDPDYTYGKEFYRSKGDKYDVNAYAKANYQLTEALSVYADLQYRFIDYTIKGINDKFDLDTYALQPLDIHKQFSFFNPKAGLFYQINKNNQAYASVSVGHREPTRNNFTDAVNSITPTSERLIDYEAGYAFANQIFSVGANLYFMDYKNQLILTGRINDVGEALTTNIPESYRTGIELMAGAKITGWLKWNGNVTFSQNRIRNFTEYVDIWDIWPAQERNNLGNTPIAFSPNVTAGSVFSADYRKWNAALMSNYVGKQYIDNSGNDARSLKAYFVNNLRVGYTFNPKGFKEIGVNILVNNLFNAKYESNAWVYSYYETGHGQRYAMDGYFPQAGTNVLANVSLKF